MKILAEQINRELRTETVKSGHCAIYENELERVWPLATENRERKIAQFAKENGFHLAFYRKGLCAIFVKEAPDVSAGRY